MKRNKEDEDLYLDWVNNFMTIERFAEYYSISKDHAIEIISRARIAREIEISNINKLPVTPITTKQEKAQ